MRDVLELLFKRALPCELAKLSDRSPCFLAGLVLLDFRVFFVMHVITLYPCLSKLGQSFHPCRQSINLCGHKLFETDSGGNLTFAEDLQKISKVSKNLRKLNLLLRTLRRVFTLTLHLL